jgi:hypothetical protein
VSFASSEQITEAAMQTTHDGRVLLIEQGLAASQFD